MTREEAICILERRSTIPDEEVSWLDIMQAINMAIEALKEQRPHGKWIPCKDDNFCKCSECQQIVMSEERSNFCPNCGADMISSNSETKKSNNEKTCLNCGTSECELGNRARYGFCGNWTERR